MGDVSDVEAVRGASHTSDLLSLDTRAPPVKKLLCYALSQPMRNKRLDPVRGHPGEDEDPVGEKGHPASPFEVGVLGPEDAYKGFIANGLFAIIVSTKQGEAPRYPDRVMPTHPAIPNL